MKFSEALPTITGGKVSIRSGLLSKTMEHSPARMDFPYPKGFLYLRLVLILTLIFFLLMLSTYFSFVGFWSISLLIVLLVYLVVVGLSPLFTNHWVTLTRLVLRQGLYFKVSIPYSEIESIQLTNEVAKYGVRSSWARDKVYIATSQRGLVSIRLKNPIRFLLILGKSATELIVSVEEPDRFVNAITEKMELLPPVDSDRAYAKLRY